MRVTEVDIDSVRPYAGNPRINSAAVDVIAESIRNYGFRQPIVVDRDMGDRLRPHALGGHEAARHEDHPMRDR